MITRSAVRSLVAAIAVAAVVAAVVQPWYVYVPSFEALDHVDIPTGDFNFAIVTDGPTSTSHLWLTTSLKALLILATSMVLLGPVARPGGRSLWLGAAAGSLLIALGVSIYVLASPSLWTAGLTCLCGASLALVLLAISQPADDVIR